MEIETEITYSCTWTLNEEERDYVRNFSGGPQWIFIRRNLPDHPWKLAIGLLQRGEAETKTTIMKFGMFPILRSDDYVRGTSTEAWIREGSIRFLVCRLLLGTGTTFDYVRDAEESTVDPLTASDNLFVLNSYVSLNDVKQGLKKSDSLIFEVKFVTAGSSTRLGHHHRETLLLRYFDSPKVADLVFRFPSPVSTPRYIFASKEYLTETCSYFETLFESGFSESADSVNLASLPTTSSHDKSFTYDIAELQPFYNINAGTVEAPKSASQTLSLTEEAREDQPRSSKRRRGDAQGSVESGERIPFIDITETDFTTYRAMLAYLYTTRVPFTALPSDYLVARQQAFETHETEESDSSFDFASPQLWLRDQFYGLKDQRDWNGIEPASPHAMYRLADCYGIEELRELARDRILRSLTVENVAYELFSPLSFDYDEIQRSVLDYFNKNWPEVKKSKALDIVLDKFASGDLPQARELIKKVWTRMVPEDTSAVEKNKKKK